MTYVSHCQAARGEFTIQEQRSVTIKVEVLLRYLMKTRTAEGLQSVSFRTSVQYSQDHKMEDDSRIACTVSVVGHMM
jgi:hypothetical protein